MRLACIFVLWVRSLRTLSLFLLLWIRSLPSDLVRLMSVWRKFEADRRAGIITQLMGTPGEVQFSRWTAKIKGYLTLLVEASQQHSCSVI